MRDRTTAPQIPTPSPRSRPGPGRPSIWGGLAAGLTGFVLAGTLARAEVPIVSPQYGAAPAPSAITTRLLAVARPTAAFLERSSRLALERAATKRLRVFARREADEQARAEADLAAAAAPAPLGPDPLDLAAAGAESVDVTAQTILSALPPILRTPGARAVAADRAIARRGVEDLAQLSSLGGEAFDTVYIDAEADGLRRLAALYRDYVQNGDDGALRAFTVHELPRVRARLAALGSRR